MDITTEFNLADIVYGIDDANKGDLIPLTIIKINVIVETTEIVVITYEVRNNIKFNGSEYEEDELLTYDEAKTLARTQLEQDINTIQGEINNL